MIDLNRVRVVLVETSHPGNIGASARAIKTMGLSQLYLVSPKSFPDKRAIEMSAGADDVLTDAICVSSLDEALLGTKLVFMTSARLREIGPPVVTPEQAGIRASSHNAADIALVFGRERIGLLKEEMLKGHYHIEIPTNPAYSSLNLSQAVQIVAYEFAKHSLCVADTNEFHRANEEPLASFEQLESFYAHLESTLKNIGFVKPSNPKLVLYRLRRLFNRVKLEEKEVNILRGILTQIMRVFPLNQTAKPYE